MHADAARVRGREVVGEVLGEGLDGRLAGVVGRVSRRVGDTLLASRDHDGRLRRRRRLLLLFLDERQEGCDPVDHAVEVRA